MKTQPMLRPRTVRVLIVDDHPIVRHGLNDLFAAEPGMAVVGEAATSTEAMAMAAAAAPDVAVVDLILGNEDGLAFVSALAKRHSAMGILVLSSHDAALYAARAFSAGAHGYVTKDQPAEELLAAVKSVAAGGRYVSPGAVPHILASMSRGCTSAGSPLAPFEPRAACLHAPRPRPRHARDRRADERVRQNGGNVLRAPQR